MQNITLPNENLRKKAKIDKGSMVNNECNLKNVSPYMSKGMIAAAGFNVETPIVNAIIGNLSGTLPTKKNEAEMIKCEICDCELSSNIVLSFHINGSRHQKRLKALEIIEQLKETNDKGVHLGSSSNPNAFKCEICSLTVNSAQQLEVHLSGLKHKKKVAKINFCVPENSSCSKNLELNENAEYPGPSVSKRKRKDEPGILTCNICNVSMNSQTQYDQHLLSKKHFSKAKIRRKALQTSGREESVKFLRFKREEGLASISNFDPFHRCYYCVSSRDVNSEKFKKLLPCSNFITKTTYNKRLNTNPFRQYSSIYRNKF